MKGDPKVIEVLNSLLADELTAVSQYMVHAAVCENWGYGKLHKTIEKRAIDEMKHAEKLIGRIVFLEGTPIVSNLNKMFIGDEVPKMFAADHTFEADAIKAYNAGIKVCGDAKTSPPVNCLRVYSRMRMPISTASKKSRTRLNRWDCKFSCPHSLVRIF